MQPFCSFLHLSALLHYCCRTLGRGLMCAPKLVRTVQRGVADRPSTTSTACAQTRAAANARRLTHTTRVG
eukprot:6676726-Alexandrium_andersonii.AAC.1